MRHRLIVISLLAACASVTLVAQSRYLVDAPGRWKRWSFTAYPDDVRAMGARPADLKALESHLLQLNTLIKNTPGFANPIGFSIETSGLIERPVDGRDAFGPALTVRPLASQLAFGPFAIIEYGTGAAAKRDDGGETPHIHFYVNLIGQAVFQSQVPDFEHIETDLARLPPPQPDMFGLPRLGDTLVLKKSAEPIWTAVSFGDTLETVARGIEQRLGEERQRTANAQKVYDDLKDPKKREERMAQYRKIAPMQKDPAYLDKMAKTEDQMAKRADAEMLPQIATIKAIVTKSEQELAGVKTMAAGLSAADKAAPACYAISDKVPVSRFRRTPGPGCDPLVRPNWKVFNPALPRTAPQVLIIDTACLRAMPKPEWAHGCTADMRLLQSIDKAALLAWLQ